MKKILILVIVIAFVTSCRKAMHEPQENNKYFPAVKAIMNSKCLGCHFSGGDWPGRPIKFDNDADIVAAYEPIKKSVADPVTPTNRRMPQDGMLSATEIDIIVKWFNKGGKITD